jgi:hypothetical protein
MLNSPLTESSIQLPIRADRDIRNDPAHSNEWGDNPSRRMTADAFRQLQANRRRAVELLEPEPPEVVVESALPAGQSGLLYPSILEASRIIPGGIRKSAEGAAKLTTHQFLLATPEKELGGLTAREIAELIARVPVGLIETPQSTSDKLSEGSDQQRSTQQPVESSVKFLQYISNKFGFSDDLMATLLDCEHVDELRSIYLGFRPLKPSDRQRRARILIDLVSGLYDAYGAPGPVLEWLKLPKIELSQKSPIDVMISEGLAGFLMTWQVYRNFTTR